MSWTIPQHKILNESSAGLKYLLKKLPNTPKYVTKDLVYQSLGPALRGKEGHWSWEDLNMSWPEFGPLDKIIWTPQPMELTFRLDIFDNDTKKNLIKRSGGKPHPDFAISRDAERHSTQAQRLGPSSMAFTEPAILFQNKSGHYELLEGWHRTIQAFAKFGDQFRAMAYIGKPGG